MDWKFSSENQKLYDWIVTKNKELQQLFGITPRTLEERVADYAEKKRKEEELKTLISTRRPAPIWKI